MQSIYNIQCPYSSGFKIIKIILLERAGRTIISILVIKKLSLASSEMYDKQIHAS